MGSSPVRLVAVTVVVLTIAACGTTVSGTARRAAGGPPPGTVDPALLNVGNYPTKPARLGVAGTAATGRVIDGQRMSNYVTGPWEADPSLVKGYLNSALVLVGTGKLKLLASSGVEAAADRHGMINGFFAARSDAENHEQLSNAVLRFPDPAAASAAAAEMGDSAALPDPNLPTTGLAPFAIPGHPDADAAAGSFDDPRAKVTWQVVNSFAAHGPYVLMQSAQTTEADRGPIAALVSRTLDLQAPLIDQFTATPVADFPNLPIDPTGMLSRTLPIEPKDAQIWQRTVYQPRGALQLQDDPVASAKLFTDTGVDIVAVGKTNVYQASDAAAASRIAGQFAEEIQRVATPANAVPGLPGSACLRNPDQSFYCVGSADRYAIESSGGQLPDAQQQTAAQYVMLTAN